MQTKVIHSPDPHHILPGESSADPVHQRSADTAEMIAHRVARVDGLVLAELGEFVLAFEVLDSAVVNDEVGGEHAGCDLTAIGAIADEAVNEVIALRGLPCG